MRHFAVLLIPHAWALLSLFLSCGCLVDVWVGGLAFQAYFTSACLGLLDQHFRSLFIYDMTLHSIYAVVGMNHWCVKILAMYSVDSGGGRSRKMELKHAGDLF